MSDGLEPTEEYDGTITVHVLKDMEGREKIQCSSFRKAVETVKQRRGSATAVKIEDRDGAIVFSSDKAAIEDWEVAWENEKRRLSVNVEEHHCPYDVISCVADDLCVQCQMDKVQDQY